MERIECFNCGETFNYGVNYGGDKFCMGCFKQFLIEEYFNNAETIRDYFIKVCNNEIDEGFLEEVAQVEDEALPYYMEDESIETMSAYCGVKWNLVDAYGVQWED